MTIIKLLLLMASAMTNFPESKSLVQVEKKTTCRIRRLDTFDMMLTCYFHVNITALQKDFTVYLYKEQQQSPKTVVSCGLTPEVFCYVAPGYKYEDDIDVHHDHTNVRMLNATTEHVGMYTCHVMGESDPGTCMLTEEETQTTTTSSLPEDRQTQSANEQSSAASKLSALKDAPGGSLAEEQKPTGTQDNTVLVVVPSVVLSVLLGIAIIAVIVALYWRRQQDEHHSDISPAKPEDSQLTIQEVRQQTHVESCRQHETEVKTRCKKDGDSCLEADSKPLMSESSELEKKGIHELSDTMLKMMRPVSMVDNQSYNKETAI